MIYFLQGLPASGKTTWAKAYAQQNPMTVRVNKDDIRAMFAANWSSKLEQLTVHIEREAVELAYKKGFDVIIDNTNLNPVHLNYYISDYGDEIQIKTFPLDVETCIERDSQRENPVGEKVIREMYNKWKSTYHWL